MKDLKLENLTPREYTELRRLVNSAKRATHQRYQAEARCASAHARLAQRKAELANSEKEEVAAMAHLNRFLAAHREKPQPKPQPQTTNQVGKQWANRCEGEALRDAERARKERFTRLG